MEFTVSFDPLHLLGLVVLGYLASLVGNVVGAIIVGVLTPSLDGQKLYVVGGLFVAAASMTPVKIVIAVIAASVTMAVCSTTGVALLWTMAVTAGLGFAFSVIAGLTARP